MSSYLAVFVTVLFWAAAFPAIRAGLDGYSAGHLVLLRFLTASSVLLVAWLLRGRKRVAWRDLPAVALLGFLGMSVYPLALSIGEQTVASGTAAILVNLSPIFTALLGALTLGERLPRLAWGGVAVAFGGAALIAFARGARLELSAGVLLVLLAALVQGGQFVLAKSLLRRYDALTLTVFSVFCGTAIDLVAARGLVTAVRNAPLVATLAVVFLGVFATAVATITWSVALARVAASTTVMFLYLVPPLSIVIAWIWLGEVPSAVTIAGGVLSIAGVALVRYASFAASASSASPVTRKIVHSSTGFAPSDL
ncbi:MAG: putative rane spanning protein [Acidobacteria bacterium]|nr:putative rane spanning protein [Acidobacteriota bacterium]